MASTDSGSASTSPASASPVPARVLQDTRSLQHILILGGGELGLSTALTLVARQSSSFPSLRKITILESAAHIPNPHGSSVDTSRIVRADYACRPYGKLALEAQHLWRQTGDDDWGGQGRYAENGYILTVDEDPDKQLNGDGEYCAQPDAVARAQGAPITGEKNAFTYIDSSYANVQSLLSEQGLSETEVKRKVEILTTHEELKIASGHSGISGDRGYVNWGSGWANAEKTVAYAYEKLKRAVSNTNIELDVKTSAKVEQINYSGLTCTGCTYHLTTSPISDPQTISADLTIAATGAWTPSLIDLHGRATATGQVLAYLPITPAEQAAYGSRPTHMNFSRGMFVIPPADNVLKIARHGWGYTSTRKCSVPVLDRERQQMVFKERHISVPDYFSPIPLEAHDALRKALDDLCPDLEINRDSRREFTKTRICWYCDTPTGDFLVDWHPDVSNLFVACGGSGHAFKFFPVVGEKVVDALEGRLDGELGDLWRFRTPCEGFDGCEDGSRGGRRGMRLEEELDRGRAEC